MIVAEFSEPCVSDRDRLWRVWATVAVLAILMSGVLLGVLIIPIAQGWSAGVDPYTAICRALGILPGSPAHPQILNQNPPTPVSQVVWTPEVLQILDEAKPERGRAKVQEVCSACHGMQGVSISPEFPNLAGQSGPAIYKELNDFHSGSRANQIMSSIAKALNESEMADVAAYYAGQPMRNPNPFTLGAPDPIVQLVELGDPKRNIPPCAACHRHGDGGSIEAPVLSEQRQEYLTAQLKMFASGQRQNDVYGRMRAIAAKLTNEEINGLAAYYRAGLR
jgi:cytochrome c553